MNAATWSISASFIPRVVNAGVPRRMPLATMGGLVSKGMAFLLTVMRRLAERVLGHLPGDALREDVHEHDVVVGAAADEAEPFGREAGGQPLRVLHHLPLIVGKAPARRLP